jgi:hypothetical protein
MGLDMFAYRLKGFNPSSPVDFGDEIQVLRESEENSQEPEDFFYWRKHPDLHGLMEEIYREKGGKEESFNCVPVQLTQEDLDRIAAVIIDDELPLTEGFFFGESTDDRKAEDIEFLEKAKQSLAEGYTIWYDSWW